MKLSKLILLLVTVAQASTAFGHVDFERNTDPQTGDIDVVRDVWPTYEAGKVSCHDIIAEEKIRLRLDPNDHADKTKTGIGIAAGTGVAIGLTGLSLTTGIGFIAIPLLFAIDTKKSDTLEYFRIVNLLRTAVLNQKATRENIVTDPYLRKFAESAGFDIRCNGNKQAASILAAEYLRAVYTTGYMCRGDFNTGLMPGVFVASGDAVMNNLFEPQWPDSKKMRPCKLGLPIINQGNMFGEIILLHQDMTGISF